VIADQATASPIRTSAVNFGVDQDKLPEGMAERLLITAAYRGSRTVVSPPQLFSSHVFFRLDNDTGRDDIRRIAALASALGLSTVPIPEAMTDFGRCSLAVEAHYDDAAARALFLGAAGAPRDHTEYEAAGRRALALLVLPDGDDALRLRPATDDGLWNEMKAQGPANFTRLLPATQAEGVRPDYPAIEWWADSMRDTAEILAEINRLTGASGASTEDPRFEQLRQKLADHLREVAQKAHQQFGTPWGLVALFLASGGKARAEIHFTGPRLVYAVSPERRPIATSRAALPPLQGHFGCRSAGGGRGQLRVLVLRLAEIAPHAILVDAVHHQLDRLRTVGQPQHQRLVEACMLPFHLLVLHRHHQVIEPVLLVHASHRDVERADPVKLFRPFQVEFIDIAVPALLEYHQFIMIFGDRARQFVARRVQVVLQVRASLIELLLGIGKLLLLLGDLFLHLPPACIVGRPSRGPAGRRAARPELRGG